MGRGGEGSPGAPPHPPTGSPHSGHCLLTRQSLQTGEKNDIICHPSVDGGGQTGRKSGRLPLLSSLTIILSTSNPSDLAIVIEIEGFPSKRFTCKYSILAYMSWRSHIPTPRMSASSFVPKTLYHAS